jgi:ribosomal protein S18 acetylase RimI-like enzyme
MSRALEICARSLFKHIFVLCSGENAPAQSLYAQLGFRKVGQYLEYRAPRG